VLGQRSLPDADAVSAQAEGLSVALLNPFFWPEVRRGSERLLHDLAAELVALGHAPTLITSHRGAPARSNEDGFEIHRHWRPPEPWTIRRIEAQLSHVPFSYLSLVAGSYDVAHAAYPTDALAALRWARRTGRPAVFSYMGTPSRRVIASRRLRRSILERVTEESDAIVTLSGVARDAMWRWFAVESRVINPAVDLDAFRPGDGRAEAPTIACASAVDDARKRIPLLLRAFALVRRSRPDARLLLTRPARPDLERRLREENPGVELVPAERDVATVFREAWASGLTSYNEAFGLVLVESLACGTPVFGARDGGVPEIVDSPEVGRLFDGDDERDVAKAILETLELAEAPGTAAACRTRAEAFDSRSAGLAHLELYRELLAR
jgi:glycosyltransferase involved in cell wall biosynthesis